MGDMGFQPIVFIVISLAGIAVMLLAQFQCRAWLRLQTEEKQQRYKKIPALIPPLLIVILIAIFLWMFPK